MFWQIHAMLPFMMKNGVFQYTMISTWADLLTFPFKLMSEIKPYKVLGFSKFCENIQEAVWVTGTIRCTGGTFMACYSQQKAHIQVLWLKVLWDFDSYSWNYILNSMHSRSGKFLQILTLLRSPNWMRRRLLHLEALAGLYYQSQRYVQSLKIHARYARYALSISSLDLVFQLTNAESPWDSYVEVRPMIWWLKLLM